MTRLPVRCYDRFPDVHIFSALIRISYLSSSGVESESPQKELRGRSRIVLLFSRILPAKKTSAVGRSVGRLFVCSSITLSFRDSKFLPVYPSIVIRRSFVVHLP